MVKKKLVKKSKKKFFFKKISKAYNTRYSQAFLPNSKNTLREADLLCVWEDLLWNLFLIVLYWFALTQLLPRMRMSRVPRDQSCV